MESEPSVIIVGAGLVGALAAVYFARKGYKVDVFEQREGSQTDVRPSTGAIRPRKKH